MKKTLGAVTLACLTALPAWAEGFYEGKTVTYIIATNPGGNYDAYGRLIGRHLEEHLGADKVIFKNLPGAGHIIGANTLYASKPDGLTIGTFNTGLIYAQILQREGIQFDLNEFSWIGKAAADPRVMVLSNNSGLGSFEDLAASQNKVLFAASGVGSASFTETKMLADGLDLNIEMIPGYQGNEGEMAMLRGEVVGQVGSLSSLQPFIDAGNGFLAIGIGGDVQPAAIAFATTDKGKSIVNLIAAMSTLGRLTAAPPGVPEDRLAELRDAYMAVMTDPDFLAEAEKLGLPIEPSPGDQVDAMVEAALNQSPDTVAIISAALSVEIPTIKVTTDILALEDRNKVVTFMSGDQKVSGEISGSRTAVSLNGAEAERGDLAVGMHCEIEYDPNSDVNEFKMISCSGEAMAAAATMMMISSKIIGLEDRNKIVTFMADGAETVGEVSGSRTTVTVNGNAAERGDLAAGMTCEFGYEAAEEIEFKTVSCTSN
ncbi:MAG: hypothetical protein HUJ27_05760 [Rhodobacteraceae bacterium]|nr:hypothetical protein [Paracoccaceae bacterium]